MYQTLVIGHTLLATVTIIGFVLRGYWLFAGSEIIGKRAVRIAPHVIDTLFLATGIALVIVLDLAVARNTWLLAKLVGLLVYIGLGMVVFRFGRTMQVRLVAFVGAVAAFAYIVGAALTKSPGSWLSAIAA